MSNTTCCRKARAWWVNCFSSQFPRWRRPASLRDPSSQVNTHKIMHRKHHHCIIIIIIIYSSHSSNWWRRSEVRFLQVEWLSSGRPVSCSTGHRHGRSEVGSSWLKRRPMLASWFWSTGLRGGNISAERQHPVCQETNMRPTTKVSSPMSCLKNHNCCNTSISPVRVCLSVFIAWKAIDSKALPCCSAEWSSGNSMG